MKQNHMILAALFSTLLLFLVGCSKPAGTEATEPQAGVQGSNPVSMNPSSADQQTTSPAGGSGSGGNIAPMAGVGAGGLTPVSGSESLQGGGSGVGQVMKEKAKDVAARGAGSVGSVGEEGQ